MPSWSLYFQTIKTLCLIISTLKIIITHLQTLSKADLTLRIFFSKLTSHRITNNRQYTNSKCWNFLLVQKKGFVRKQNRTSLLFNTYIHIVSGFSLQMFMLFKPLSRYAHLKWSSRELDYHGQEINIHV